VIPTEPVSVVTGSIGFTGGFMVGTIIAVFVIADLFAWSLVKAGARPVPIQE
jgi:hypothetical protein